jgi:hypothetical protein
LRFVTWTEEDELSGLPAEQHLIAGRIMATFVQDALDRGHEHLAFDSAPHDFWLAVNGPTETGFHLEIGDVEPRRFHLMLCDDGPNVVAWRVGSRTFREPVGSQWAPQFSEFLDALEPEGGRSNDVRPLLEAFTVMWQAVAPSLEMTADERRTADAFATLLGELSKSSHPPRGVVRSVLLWVKPRLDLFGDEFASAAGKTLGAGAGAAATAGVAYGSSKIPELRHLVAEILQKLST